MSDTIRTFRETFPHVAYFAYLQQLRKHLAGCRSCLEIGCGPDSPARRIPFERYVGIDGHAPTVAEAKRRDPAGDYRLARAEGLRSMFSEGEFDCVIGLDLIEHLTKEDGLRLMDDMAFVARRRILLFTPNGFLPQASEDGDLQEHLSGWTAEEMQGLGFTVTGTHGPKLLRTDHHRARIRPRTLGGVISQALQLYTYHAPRHAAAILCVKDVAARNPVTLRSAATLQ